MTNSVSVRQHKKRQRHRHQERRQLELEELLGQITPLSESSLCQCNTYGITDVYQPIPPLSNPLDFWAKVPDMCNPNAAVMDSALEAVDSQKLARDRRFQAKLEQKLESREQRGEISKEDQEKLWQQHGRMHKKQTSGGDDAPVVSLLSAHRGQRKSMQVENFVTLLQDQLRPGMTVVDFGSGSGNLCLALAAYFPRVRFVLVDKNDYSLQLVQRRAEASNLTNIQVQQFNFSADNLHNYQPPPANWDGDHDDDNDDNSMLLAQNPKGFDVGLGLHCCGSFTDMVMEVCWGQTADCIVCPCCNGGMKYTGGFQYPRSTFLKACMSQDDYLFQLSKSADDLQNYTAKCWIEYDRALWAHEQGMHVELWKMTPVECTPKHHVLYIKHKK